MAKIRTLSEWVNIIPDERGRKLFINYIKESFSREGERVGVPKSMLQDILDLAWNEKFPTFEEAARKSVNLLIFDEPEQVMVFKILIKQIDAHVRGLDKEDFANNVLSNLNFEEDEK